MSEIRSVSVRLDADVAGYIAKMRLAGAETDKAFGHTDESIQRVNTGLTETDRGLTRVDSSARKVDTSMRRVDTTMRSAADNGLSKASSKLDSMVGRLGTIPALAVAGTAALTPLAAEAVAVGAAFAAPLAFVGGAVTLFGFLDGAAIHQTNNQLSAISSLQKRLAGLKQGTAEYTVVALDLKQAQDALTPAQKDYAASLGHLKGVFDDFLGGRTGQQLLEPVAQTLDLAADLLPKAEPIIKAVSGDLSELLGELDRYAQTPGFDRFVAQMSNQVGPDLLAFGHIAGNVAHGIGQLLLIFGKRLSPELLSALEGYAREFDRFANSKQGRQDVEDFIAYVHRVGPDAADAIDSLAHGADHLVRALAPLGPPTLHVIKGIADAFSSIPTGVLTDLAGAGVGLVALQKLGGGKALTSGLRGLSAGTSSGGLGGVLSKAGATPVYVVNMPGGGLGVPGVGGGPGGLEGDAAKVGKFGGLGLIGGLNTLGVGIGFLGAEQQAQGLILGRLYGSKLGNAISLGLSATMHLPAPLTSLPGGTGGTKGFGLAGELLQGPDGLLNQVKAAEVHLTSTGTAFDALRAHAQQASATIDQIGPHARNSFGAADSAVSAFQARLDALHDKRLAVILDDRAAVSSLERLQAMTIRDKSFTVTERFLQQERAVGPGGGIQHHADGGHITGLGGPTSDSIPAWLSNGEFVMRAAAVQHYGLGMMHAVNAGRFADGGTVNTYTSRVTTGPYAGSGLGAAADDAARGLRGLRVESASLTKQLDAEKQERQQVAQARMQLVSSVRDQFRTQLFGVQADPNGSVWDANAGALTDPLQILNHNIHQSRAYTRDIRRLHRRGLTGGALAQVTTLADAQQALGLSPSELKAITARFAIEQKASRAAGRTQGDFRFGKALDSIDGRIAETNHRLHAVETAIKHDTAEAKKNAKDTATGVGREINHAASTAVRRKRPGS